MADKPTARPRRRDLVPELIVFELLVLAAEEEERLRKDENDFVALEALAKASEAIRERYDKRLAHRVAFQAACQAASQIVALEVNEKRDGYPPNGLVCESAKCGFFVTNMEPVVFPEVLLPDYVTDADVILRLKEFIDLFVLVFDNDWEFSRALMDDENYIAGSFIHPGVDDESNNWCNRGRLLGCFRALVDTMKGNGCLPEFTHYHCKPSGAEREGVEMPDLFSWPEGADADT